MAISRLAATMLCCMLLICGTRGFRMSIYNKPRLTSSRISPSSRSTSRNAAQSHQGMKGRLGHLRPRLWSSVAAVEEASPTSLSAAKKFKNFEEMLLNFGDSLVVVTFANDLCGPCRLMKKELNQVSSQLGEDVKIFAIDTERFPKLGTKYEVRKLPTVVVFKGGRVHDRIEGVARADLLLERLRQLL